MGTRYLSWSEADIKRAAPSFSASKLTGALIKQLGRELKDDKRYAAQVDDPTISEAILTSVEGALGDVLRKLKAAPTAVELYTDTGFLSRESNLLLKLTCEGPLNGRPIKLEVDWKRVKGELRLGGKVAGDKRPAAPKSWTVLSHPDLWPRIKARLSKDTLKIFDLKSLPVQVDLVDADALEQLAASVNPVLALKVKEKVRWPELHDALVEAFEKAAREIQADPSRQKAATEALRKSAEVALIDAGAGAAEAIFAAVKIKVKRDAYELTSDLDLEPTLADAKKGSGGVMPSVGASGLTALWQLTQGFIKAVGPIAAGLKAREDHRRDLQTPVETLRTRHGELTRKGSTDRDNPLTDDERAEALLKGARGAIEDTSRALKAWRDANEALATQTEGAYKTLERAWTQLEKTQVEVGKLADAVHDVKDELKPALVKKAGKLSDRYEDLHDLLEPAFDDLETALKGADRDDRVLEDEARALAPLLGDSPSWTKLDGGIPELARRLDDLGPAPSKATLDRLEAWEKALKWIKELKEDHEEIDEALAELRKKR